MKYSAKTEQRGRSRPQTGDVRRLCTKSSVGTSELHHYTTLWRWYWVEDDGRWIEFGYTKHGTKVHGSLSSRDIEEEFTSDPESNISFSRGRFAYELHLGTMRQVNMGTRKERTIKRRPAPFDASTKQPMKHGGAIVKSLMDLPTSPPDVAASVPSLLTGSSADAFHAGKTMYPTHWTSIPSASCDGFQLISIQPNGATAKEYADINQLFKLTLPEMKLKSIRRIQNVELWDAFYRKKSWMEKKLQSSNATKAGNEGDTRGPRGGDRKEGGRKRAVSAGRCGKSGGELSVFSPAVASLNVQRLFHGTKKSIIDAICQQGFDWRLNGTSVGTIYGKGSYFAKQASYSASYTDCRTLFVAQVLVGAYAQGLPVYVRPPPKNPNKPLLDLYDSCVDNMVEPNIFVVFAQEQAYPEYLIEY